MLRFGVVYSKSRFTRQLVNCQFDCCLVLRAGSTEARNRKVNIPTNLFRRHERHGGLRILNRASVRNHISRGKLIVSIFVKLL